MNGSCCFYKLDSVFVEQIDSVQQTQFLRGAWGQSRSVEQLIGNGKSGSQKREGRALVRVRPQNYDDLFSTTGYYGTT
jgi:hypothetical protein